MKNLKKIAIIGLIVPIILVSGCKSEPIENAPQNTTPIPQQNTEQKQTQQPQAKTNTQPPQNKIIQPPKILGISMEEVSKHNSASSCWTVVNGKVYDVTSYISKHPGGAQILLGCGTDATSLFNEKHSDKVQKARENLQNYYLDNLK